MERFVERFRYKATKARQAQSKLKQIERMRAARCRRPTRATGARSRSLRRRGALRAGGARARGRDDRGRRPDADRGRRAVARARRARLPGRRQRLAARRPWSRSLVGERELDAGKLRPGHNVNARLPLPALGDRRRAPTATVLAHAQRSTGLSEAKTRALLGRFLFSGEEVAKRARRDLRRRGPAAGAGDPDQLRRQPAGPRRADQPPRRSRAARRSRTRSRAFDGTLLLVSHDRALLEAVGSRTVVIEDGALRSHPGGWAEYRAAEEAKRAAEARAGDAEARRPQRVRRARARTARRDSRGSSARSRAPRPRSRGSRTSSPTRRTGSTRAQLGAGERAPRGRAGAQLDEADRALGAGGGAGRRLAGGRPASVELHRRARLRATGKDPLRLGGRDVLGRLLDAEQLAELARLEHLLDDVGSRRPARR